MTPARKKQKLAHKTSSNVKSKVTPSRPHDQTQCPFFKLPPEIRLTIYECLFANSQLTVENITPFDKTQSTFKIYRDNGYSTSLIRTCRRIRDEAKPVYDICPLTYHNPSVLPYENYPGYYRDTANSFNIKTIPPHYLQRITAVKLKKSYQHAYCWQYFPNLKLIYLDANVKHFGERDRARLQTVNNEAVGKTVWKALTVNEYRLWRRGPTFAYVGVWNYSVGDLRRADIPCEVDPILPVWYLNTQRDSGEGWVVGMCIETRQVKYVKRALFTKRPFDEAKFEGKDYTNGRKNTIRREWKYSSDGWSVKMLD